jgi:hypothetical protein
MKKVKEYPYWVCQPCGQKHGQKQKEVSCWHYGKCDVCGKSTDVTQPRDFGHFKDWFK